MHGDRLGEHFTVRILQTCGFSHQLGNLGHPHEMSFRFFPTPFGDDTQPHQQIFLRLLQLPCTLFHFHFEDDILNLQCFLGNPQREMGFHPCLHLGDIKRFGDIVHRTHFKAFGFVFRIIQSGNKNNGNVFRHRIALEYPANLETVHLRHQDIQQNEVQRIILRMR